MEEVLKQYRFLEGNPKTLPQEHDKENLEELFIAITREPSILKSI